MLCHPLTRMLLFLLLLLLSLFESLQLDHSKDVVAQAQAVVGLAGQLGSSRTACACPKISPPSLISCNARMQDTTLKPQSLPSSPTLCCCFLMLLLVQLDHSKDVVAQAQAVVGLAGQLGSSSAGIDGYIVTVLAGVMRNPAVFCRCDTRVLMV
jgi:hypothetical protein